MENTNELRDYLFNSISDRIMGTEITKEAAIKEASSADVLGDFAFKVLPILLYGVPFMAGSSFYATNRDLNAQENKHKRRMKLLKQQFPEELLE